MIRAGVVWGLAVAESRLTRRLVRYWVFQVIALLIGVLGVAYYGFLHKMFSSYSGTAALLNPRYLMAFIGIYYLVGFLLGLVFLGFDIRARDKRERIIEIVDSLPFSNIELMLGRYIGILLPCWIPVVVICGLLWVVAWLLGARLEPLSMVAFSFLLAIPAYCFVLGLTFLLTMLLRHRLLAALAAVAVIVGLIVINFGFVPIYMLPLVDLTGGFSAPNVSDLTPTLFDMRSLAQRGGFLFLGLSMLWFATAVHPRRDDSSRAMTAGVGAAMLAVSMVLLLGQVMGQRAVISEKKDWRAVHEARGDDPAPDLLAMNGDVRIDPGRRIRFELDLNVAAPADNALQTALFTLNPGMQVEEASDPSGNGLTFEHEDGLLDIRLAQPLGAGEETTIRLVAEGVPDMWFAFIDSAFEPFDISIREGNIFILGFQSLIFDKDFTVLLPEVRWLPAPGTDVGRGDPHGRPRDFFDLDLTVDIPDGLLVAGPGKRQEQTGAESGRSRFRFAPPASLPGVALVAGPLESRSTEIGGVTLEVLVHPKHTRNLEFLQDANGEIHDWLKLRLEEAEQIGLGYPYDGLTLVEVPGYLRGYSGGWRMDTTFAQPGLVLMRESGFPTARLETPFDDPDNYKDKEGGIPRGKREVLERFFENDFSGGNPFIAASRSFFSNQTSGTGDVGLAMDYICEDLSTRLVTDKQGYFSVHHYGKDMGQTINATIGSLFNDQGTTLSDAMVNAVTSRTEVWDQVLEVSLADLDPWEAPKRALDVLTLKGGAMSRSMLDGLGRQKTGEVLAALRRRTAGGAYAREDVIAAGAEADVDLEPWLDVWLEQTALPGFTTGSVSAERLEDTDDGSPRYQMLLTVINGEATPGLLRLEYQTEESDARSTPEKTEPVNVPATSAVELGLVTSGPLRMLRVVPYLALNRNSFNVALPAVDEENLVDKEPYSGSREIEWTAVKDEWIIVDDLDAGFEVIEEDSGAGLRFAGRGIANEDTDQGLPVAQPGQRSSRWSRRTQPSAYGRYRHTLATVRAGSGKKKAVFNAEIPSAGPWELEYHLPQSRGNRSRRLGTWHFTVVDPSGSQEVEFKAGDAEPGWNSIGTFEIADGETRIEVSDIADDGRVVVADAIRWIPASSSGSEASQP